MPLPRLLEHHAELCHRHARLVVLASVLVAVLSGFYAAHHLRVSTNTDDLFDASLPWRQRAAMFNRDFPQFSNLLVAVIDAQEPEEADATAADLATALAADHAHFLTVRRPDASPFLRKEGLLFLDVKQLSALLDSTIDAQPFLGQLVADPTARGLFSALALLGMGASRGDADLTPYDGALQAFHQAIARALDGHATPLSWQRLLGGGLSDLAGKYRFVLVQPRQNYGALEAGRRRHRAMRAVVADLPFVQSRRGAGPHHRAGRAGG